MLRKSPVPQYNYGYVVSVKFEKVKGKFNGCIVLTEKIKISNIYIIRTLIYFHGYINPKYAGNIKYNFLGDFLSYPKEKSEDIESKNTYLVDVGLLIKIENEFINAFVKDNDDDFYKFEGNYLLENFDFKDLPKEYGYISLNKKLNG